MKLIGIELPDSPQVKFWTWVVGIVATTIFAWLWVDNYFAHAADVKKIDDNHTAQIAQLAKNNDAQLVELKMQVEYSADQNAKRGIDNQLFQLEQIPPDRMRPQDRALMSKLLRDRQELVNLWNRRGRPLR